MPRPEGGGSRCGGGGGGPQGGGWVHKEGAGDYWELWDRWVTTGRKWLEIYRLWVYKFKNGVRENDWTLRQYVNVV